MVDIAVTRRFTDFESLEKTILELNSRKDTSIREVLWVYLTGIESFFPNMLCSIHGIKNNRLLNWAAPSLPTAYIDSLEDLLIGNNTGSCGTAAFLKQKVIVSDIANDPRWANYKHLALSHGLYACWSHPIINSEGVVLATFANYYRTVKIPTESELKAIERSVAILTVILENRQNIEVIREANLLMAQGQELAHFGNWQWDLQHNIVSWSESLYSIYGLKHDSFEATFEGYRQLLHPMDRERVYHLIQNALDTKQDVTFEERIIRPTGELRYLRSWGKVQVDNEGNLVKMIGACLDITESKKAEDALKKSNERYEYVNKATNDAIYDWNVIRDHLEWGDGFYRIFGYENNGEVYPIEKWLLKVHPADREKTEQSLKLKLEDRSQTIWSTYYQFVKADGRYAFVEENGFIIRNSKGRAVRMIGVMRDITKQKQEEHRLKLLESVVIHTHDSVLITESDSSNTKGLKILYANDVFTKMTGYNAEELIGKCPEQLMASNTNPNDLSKVFEAICNQKPLERETIKYKKDGKQFWINLTLNPVADDTGATTHWICIGHDVTERMNYIMAIEKQNQQLQEIAFMQSHVVRAPLTRMMGLIDLVKNYQNSDSEKEELLKHILSSAYEFDQIIRDISAKTKLI
jgi:PAS domain S-box-containing protein